MPHLFKCSKCNEYTLDSKQCPRCGAPVLDPRPPKYSPQDKYGVYRRRAKRKTMEPQSES
ncbi:MAG: nucleolar RNA-binding Nop10p family protein [Candidatus Thorarchaeota archaeon]